MDRASVRTPSQGKDAPIALAALYRRHRAELCRYALRYVEHDDAAEDVVQQVFVRLLGRPPDLDSVRDVSSYLRRAVHNEALHRIERARTARQYRAVTADGLRSLAPSPAEEMHRRALAAALDRAIDGLPPRCRQAFVLIRTNGLTYAEAAEEMGISIKTVKEQLRRARRVLRERLAEHSARV
ncbi:MAG TPA: RNA polymerase sigma-70 factor [Longimicrobiales bacterium]